jgi:plasmid stabilization system protein ParE
MAKLIWTDESLESLRLIGEYLSEKSPEAAAKVTEGVYNKAQVLKKFPELGWRHEEVVNRNLRSLVYGHYRIVYEIFAGDIVRVVTVLHSAIDITKLKF